MTSAFNYNLLIIARQSRNVNQETLAKLAGITQGHLSKIENGLTEPSEDVVSRLSQSLEFPASFFYQTDRVYGLPVSVHPMLCRKKASVGQKALDKIHAELNIRLIHFRRFLNAIEFTNKFPMPYLDVDEFNCDIDKIAEMVRRTWLIPPGPLGNLTEYLEMAGCLVVWCDFANIGIDGITLSAPDVPPCIFINRFQPSDRMRFTLAHELGHLVMHRIPTPDMEDQADEFASAFLMPYTDIRSDFLGKLTLQRLASLKPRWRVSMQALLMRAKTIGAISQRQSQSLWKEISMHRIRLQEPPELDFPPDEPKVIPRILKLHLDQLGYSIHELAKAVHIKEPEFRQMYHFSMGNLLRNGLRVIPKSA